MFTPVLFCASRGAEYIAAIRNQKWFRDNLNGETANRFDELISCHNNIVDTMSYENFRTGFQLGVMMVMEAVSENEAVLFEL